MAMHRCSGTVSKVTNAQEPQLFSGDDMPSIIDQLIRLEPLFHHPELGTSYSAFDAQTAGDFWEVGASGQCYSREYVWSVLQKRCAGDDDDPWETSEFKCRQLSLDTYLLTYLLRQDERFTRRATIWQVATRGWQIIYHQGTVIADPS
jgi:hypothetical protein